MKKFLAAFFIIVTTIPAFGQENQIQNYQQTTPSGGSFFSGSQSDGHKPSLQELKQWGEQVGMPWRHGNRLWCALWMNQRLVSRGLPPSRGYTASSFANYGSSCGPTPGAIAWNNRHVCEVVAFEGNTILCQGGNQGANRSVSTNRFPIGQYRYRCP